MKAAPFGWLAQSIQSQTSLMEAILVTTSLLKNACTRYQANFIFAQWLQARH